MGPQRVLPPPLHARSRAASCTGELFDACGAHDSAKVAALLPRARDHINALGPEGDTLLHIASLYGFADLVEALLAAGADPEVKDESGSTPLHDASAGGYLPIVARLLQVCPQLALEEDDDKESALHCAARGGFPEVVAALLAAGADRAKVNAEGATPLQLVDAEDAATAALLAG